MTNLYDERAEPLSLYPSRAAMDERFVPIYRRWQEWLPVRTARAFAHAALRPWVRYMLRLRVFGTEHVPRRAPLILASNHRSHADTGAVLAALPGGVRWRVAPGAAKDYFFRNALLATATRLGVNALSVARSGPQSQTVIDSLTQFVGNGPGDPSLRRAESSDDSDARLPRIPPARFNRALLLYPEGGRLAVPEGVGELKKGVAWIALGARVPIVPVAVRHTEHALPRGVARPRRVPADRPVSVRFGAPLDPREFLARHPDDPYAAASALTAALHERLVELLGHGEPPPL